jgi:hypothetical protein
LKFPPYFALKEFGEEVERWLLIFLSKGIHLSLILDGRFEVSFPIFPLPCSLYF